MFIRLSNILAALLPLTLSTFSVQAGEGNVISLTQRGSHNTISIDQSNAFGSHVTGANYLRPALQSGTGNQANLRLRGHSGRIALQQGGALGTAHNNQAQIVVNAHHAGALVQQSGDANSAQISVEGSHGWGQITQSSNHNDAQLNIFGNHANGSIVQNQGDGNRGHLDVLNGTAQLVQSGTGNDTQLQVNATGAGHVTYILQADHTVQAAGPVAIDHSGPSITIIQTQ